MDGLALAIGIACVGSAFIGAYFSRLRSIVLGVAITLVLVAVLSSGIAWVASSPSLHAHIEQGGWQGVVAVILAMWAVPTSMVSLVLARRRTRARRRATL